MGWLSLLCGDGEGGYGLRRGRIRVATRTGRLVQGAVPELAPMAMCGHAMVLDGELLAGDGLPPSVYRLAGRLGATRRQTVARGVRTTPLTFVMFDLLWLNGRLTN